MDFRPIKILFCSVLFYGRKKQRGKIKIKQRGMGKMYGVDLVSL
jgi:hypothetical protein